jgi:transcription elongation factor GreA
MKSIPFTKDGFTKIEKEYEELKASRPDAVMHLKRARELGDLSENGYYKASRAKLSFIDSRLRHLKHLISNAAIIQSSASDTVEIGKTIVVDDGKGERVFEIVGGYESNPLEGRISHISPLGKALMGARVGEKRVFESPAGKKEYTVVSIES